MATAPLDPDASLVPTGLRLVTRVGIARWTVLLPASTVLRLGREHPDAGGGALDPVALHRVMEGVRIKAVGVRRYGGGTVSIDPSDLADAPVTDGEDGDDVVLRAAPWYTIVEIAPIGSPALRLMA